MNALGKESSLYLLQHADNPVAWYPWGEEALQLAKDQDKPILLSIGYAACHWCHVMAHESFEDEQTAALMNEYFVNVKVDREERPDLDRIYQTAHYLLTQRNGGWPLTIFLTPDDLVPFYAGTYFPPQEQFGLPAFRDLLLGVADLYRNRRDDVSQQTVALKKSLDAAFGQGNGPVVELGPQVLQQAVTQLAESYDSEHGGFGKAPKFPHPTSLDRLLRHWLRTRREGEADLKALEMLAYTLKKMALGGVYDQIGGGFYRYSTDDVWMIPHFEKMLYDNAQLLPLYAQAGVATGSSLFRRVATEVAEWVIREMQGDDGGYFSSMDADSEGEEGRFYVWTQEALRELLTDDEYIVAAHRFGFNRPANFEGKWLPHVYMEYEALETSFSQPQNELRRIVDFARAKLLEARQRRAWPLRDEKVLTSWNALMIRGMLVAGRLLERADFIDSAERALGYLRTTMWVDGRLRATGKNGQSRLPAYLDDYAFLLDAVLEMLQTRWDSGLLRFARSLADVMLEHFEDKEQGGFFFTADDHEALLQRPRPWADEALPAGNAVVAKALLRLGFLLGERRYLASAERTVSAASAMIARSPMVHSAMLSALEEQLQPPQLIVLRGDEQNLEEWHRIAQRQPDPGLLCFPIPSEAPDLPPVLAMKEPRDEHTVGYLCEGLQCREPVVDVDEFAKLLGEI